MKGTYWKKPRLMRSPLDGGGDLLLGPVQLNWYNDGVRLHVTWPVFKTFHLWGNP